MCHSSESREKTAAGQRAAPARQLRDRHSGKEDGKTKQKVCSCNNYKLYCKIPPKSQEIQPMGATKRVTL